MARKRRINISQVQLPHRSGLRTSVESLDMFGHSVQLNFDKSSPMHRTVCGGITSLLIYLLLGVYLSLLVKRLLLFEDDNISTENLSQDFPSMGPIGYNETDMNLFVAFHYNNYMIPYDEAFKKHLKVVYRTMAWDLRAKDFAMEIGDLNDPEPCQASDFDRNEATAQKFEHLKQNFHLLCFPKMRQWQLEGSINSDRVQSFQINLELCNPETPGCASREETEAFFKKLTLIQFGIFDQVDFSVRGEGVRPTFQQMKFINRYQPKLGVTGYIQLPLRQNKIETHDSYLTLGYPTMEDSYFDIAPLDTYTEVGDSDKLMEITLFVYDQYQKHTRKIYNLLDLLGDVGGTIEVLTAVAGLLVTPFTFTAFQMTAMRKFFSVKSSNYHEFLEDKGVGHKHLGAMSIWDHIGVVLVSSPLGYCCRQSPAARLKRLLSRGERMLEEEMNVEHLLKQLRGFRLLTRSLIKKGDHNHLSAHSESQLGMLLLDQLPRPLINLDEASASSFEQGERNLDSRRRHSSQEQQDPNNNLVFEYASMPSNPSGISTPHLGSSTHDYAGEAQSLPPTQREIVHVGPKPNDILLNMSSSSLVDVHNEVIRIKPKPAATSGSSSLTMEIFDKSRVSKKKKKRIFEEKLAEFFKNRNFETEMGALQGTSSNRSSGGGQPLKLTERSQQRAKDEEPTLPSSKADHHTGGLLNSSRKKASEGASQMRSNPRKGAQKKVGFKLDPTSSNSRSHSREGRTSINGPSTAAHHPPSSLKVTTTPSSNPSAKALTATQQSRPQGGQGKSASMSKRQAMEELALRQDSFDPKKMSLSEIDRMLFELDSKLKTKKR